MKTDQEGYGLNLVFVESQFAVVFLCVVSLFFRIEFLTARDQIICDKTNEVTMWVPRLISCATFEPVHDKTNEMAYVDAQAD